MSWNRFPLALLSLSILSLSWSSASSQENPDFIQGETIPEGANHDWTLGPTGARGWMYCHKMETSEARQVAVTSVDDDSPAEGVLREGDVILGVGDQDFSFDPRTELGRAISDAESSDGRLRLKRWRAGKTKSVVIRLNALGAYAPTAPFDCDKSKRIFEQGCEALARKMKANPSAGNPIQRSYNALALLSSGRADYLPLVRQQVEWASKYSDLERRSLHSWFYGPITILVAEYTLATGDKEFMKDLERLTLEIVKGQSPVGSWGHRFVQGNGRLSGYGMMNAPGLPLTVSLVLARMAGVKSPELDKAIENSVRLVRFYVGKGSVPYGDHHPWIQTHDDNGKNGVATVLFDLLQDQEAATYFSRMSVASHGAERDTGHTGNFFNVLWAMPGVSRSGPHASGAWLQEFGWYYDLARRWDGTFFHQGAPKPKWDSYKKWDSTGAMLLAYAAPLKQIYLTGKKASAASQVDAQTAKALIANGRGWSPRRRIESYGERSKEEILNGLSSWSPVVRERSAMELARREGNPTKELIPRLSAKDGYTQLGACQALIHLKGKGADAVPALRETLQTSDLWLRIKAAEALASIGKEAMSAVPDLLTLLASEDPERDPRGMQQRYLCFSLFNRRGGMLGRSLEGVDREALYAAVRTGLRNEDGRARGSFSSVYNNLSYQEIEPLLPAIHQAVINPSPSGIMFADGIRTSGLEILAKHKIREGLSLCLELSEPERWGFKNRLKGCLKALRLYGGAAKSEVPKLRELKAMIAEKRWKPKDVEGLGIAKLIEDIQTDENPPQLKPLGDAR